MKKVKKTKTAKFRIEQKKWDLLTKKCKELRLTNSQFLRYCVNILLNMSPEKELDFKENTIDRFRFYKMLNRDRFVKNSYELRKIGVNLNQYTYALNKLLRRNLLPADFTGEVKECINTITKLKSEIDEKLITIEKMEKEFNKNV